MKYINRKEERDTIYRQVEAMYHKGCSNEEIIRTFPDLARFEVLDMIQHIFGREQIKKERRK